MALLDPVMEPLRPTRNPSPATDHLSNLTELRNRITVPQFSLTLHLNLLMLLHLNNLTLLNLNNLTLLNLSNLTLHLNNLTLHLNNLTERHDPVTELLKLLRSPSRAMDHLSNLMELLSSSITLPLLLTLLLSPSTLLRLPRLPNTGAKHGVTWLADSRKSYILSSNNNYQILLTFILPSTTTANSHPYTKKKKNLILVSHPVHIFSYI